MAQKERRQSSTPLAHRICERLDLPEDAMRNCNCIEIISNCCATVDGCKSVMEYDSSVIKLDLGKLRVRFLGSGLSIRSLTLEQAVIEGTIIAAEFCE